MTKHPIHVAALDDQGNGYVVVPAAAGKVVSVRFNGGLPQQNGYHPPPRWDSDTVGADEQVNIYGGSPHGVLDLDVWVVG